MAMSYQIAQKVHAATNPHDPPAFRNERPRDVVDLILIKRFIVEVGSPSLADIAVAIQDIFASRAEEARSLGRSVRTWPARLIAYPHWRGDFELAAQSACLELSLDDAVREVNCWLDEIDNMGITADQVAH